MLGRPQGRREGGVPGDPGPIDGLARTKPQDDHGWLREEKLDHPTQKPALLFETPIRNHLRPGGRVYDPFVGSGTAIIAAEVLGRKALAMEIDPRFVQLSIGRWQRFTGRTAERLDG